MPRPNDVDFSMHVWPHGWSSALLWVDVDLTEFRLSHVFNDPVESLIHSLAKLVRGEKNSSLEWSDEPGAWKIEFTEMNDAKHLLRVTASEYDRELPMIENRTPLKTLEFIVTRKFWIQLTLGQLRKLSESFADPHYRKAREYQFPHKWLAELMIAHKANA
jgi:hypothetical protein